MPQRANRSNHLAFQPHVSLGTLKKATNATKTRSMAIHFQRRQLRAKSSSCLEVDPCVGQNASLSLYACTRTQRAAR